MAGRRDLLWFMCGDRVSRTITCVITNAYRKQLMSRIIEIRTYNLKPGTHEKFASLARDVVRPMLQAHGTDVVANCGSLTDENTHCLIRAYATTAERESSQAEFYGGALWREGPRDAVLSCIENYATVVLTANEATINSLRDAPARQPTGHAQLANDGSHDFDFFMGRWRIQNKRLVRRLAGCTDWETFEASQYAQSLPGGIGNFDDFVADDWRRGFVGMSLRVFSPVTKKWSIYWLDNNTGGLDGATGHLTPPVVGEFKNGVGIFIGTDVLDGRPINVEYKWSNITANSARWEQAFSADGGKTWETNWIMELRRVRN